MVVVVVEVVEVVVVLVLVLVLGVVITVLDGVLITEMQSVTQALFSRSGGAHTFNGDG